MSTIDDLFSLLQSQSAAKQYGSKNDDVARLFTESTFANLQFKTADNTDAHTKYASYSDWRAKADDADAKLALEKYYTDDLAYFNRLLAKTNSDAVKQAVTDMGELELGRLLVEKGAYAALKSIKLQVAQKAPAIIPANISKQSIIADAKAQDTLAGGGVQDTLAGGGVQDTLAGAGIQDTLAGAGIQDTLAGAGIQDTLAGGGVQDTLAGGGVQDTLAGGGVQDTLAGGGVQDTLAGGGQSTLAGGGVQDTLAGGGPRIQLRPLDEKGSKITVPVDAGKPDASALQVGSTNLAVLVEADVKPGFANRNVYDCISAGTFGAPKTFGTANGVQSTYYHTVGFKIPKGDVLPATLVTYQTQLGVLRNTAPGANFTTPIASGEGSVLFPLASTGNKLRLGVTGDGGLTYAGNKMPTQYNAGAGFAAEYASTVPNAGQALVGRFEAKKTITSTLEKPVYGNAFTANLQIPVPGTKAWSVFGDGGYYMTKNPIAAPNPDPLAAPVETPKFTNSASFTSGLQWAKGNWTVQGFAGNAIPTDGSKFNWATTTVGAAAVYILPWKMNY